MPLTAEQVIEQGILRAKEKADKDRMKEAQNKLDIYTDDYEDIIKDKMEELFTDENYKRMQYHVNQSQNILKRVINEISTIYKVEPQRELSEESDRWAEIAKDNNLNLKMKKVNRYTNLLNECLLKISVRHGKIYYDIITPNICFVFQNAHDPTLADAIVYLMTWVDTRNNTKIEYHYWSVAGDYWVFDENYRLDRIVYADMDKGEEDYPYKDENGVPVLPFVACHRQDPEHTFWDQHSGRDLYNAAVLTGVKMTQFDYYFKTCSFKQVYMIGDIANIPQDQILDPLTAIAVPPGEGASVGTLDIQANLNQLRDALVFQINSVINNWGISADQWTLSIAEMSGIALRIRNMPLIEIRQDQIPLYRNYENDLFKKTRIVNNAYPKFFDPIPEKAEFAVDFGDITFPEDRSERFTYRTKLLQSGLISLGQYYQDFNPDIKDEEEAKKKILENIKELKQIKEENPELDVFLNALMGIQEKAPAGGEGEAE